MFIREPCCNFSRLRSVCDGFARTDRLELLLRLRRLLRRVQAVTGNQARKLELVEQRVKRIVVGLPHKISLRDEIYRRVFADGCQVIGQIRLLAVFFKLFAHGFLDLRQMLVNAIQRSVFQKQARRRLGADARHTRDIIRAVTHKALEINKAHGIEAILRAEHVGGIVCRDGLSGFRRDKLDGHAVRYQLQRVPVARDNYAVCSLARADFARRAQNIVRFPALTFVDGDVHRAQDLFHERHLHCQLLRHRMARGFIAVVGQMAERQRFEVERDA